MAYLDLSPMLEAMRTRPDEFEMQGPYLRHKPSHHLLNFDLWGNAHVHARCDCAMLDIARDQSDEMKGALSAWKIMYWEPHLARLAAEKRAAAINREFAAHFRPGFWRHLRALSRGGRRWVNIEPREVAVPAGESDPAPAARERKLASPS